MKSTQDQYTSVVSQCRNLFLQKTRDYGSSWRVYRPISVVDQIFIKAKRIRTIQEAGRQLINDSIDGEFTGILNYAVIGLIQLSIPSENSNDLDFERVETLYDEQVKKAADLFARKNHDYGEAWREMSQESYTDLILAKLLRIRQILANDGLTLVSEGIDANYLDIFNYAAFALIMIGEGKHKS
ncbi:DUF1599 domain-containing protein [Flavihumibacter petaseus]|uniref:Nucleotide modification associated domain-containing protein n=1 Tax=Flavihumibacter petaseus NBRC 106054 TaxID=1220578 RepID=A0A0E9N8D0_9BACT|nr:DUF1599 domain-containing protein [Flavihumibacter petaseus]GAO45645.1 hypothetical protein FPE01S_07_00330 [Flavihumibacter petaseus NBRC 106054]